MTAAMLGRRIRLRSGKDVILLVILIVIYIGLKKLFEKILPDMQEKTAKIIITVIQVIVAVIWVFTVKP